MIPVNLGQRQMRIGMGQGVPPELAQMLAQQQPQGAPAPEQAQSTNPRSMAVADVLSNPVTVESGHWGEALAEALGSGIRGRAMRDVYGREQEQQQQALESEGMRQKAEDGRDIQRHDLEMQQLQAEVLAAQNPTDWQTNGVTPYRIDPATGRVIVGAGAIPHRPRQPLIQYGGGAPDGDLEPYNGP